MFALTHIARQWPELEPKLYALFEEASLIGRDLHGAAYDEAANRRQWQDTLTRQPPNPVTAGTLYKAAAAIGGPGQSRSYDCPDDSPPMSGKVSRTSGGNRPQTDITSFCSALRLTWSVPARSWA